MYVCVYIRVCAICVARVCVCVRSCCRFLVEVTDLPKAGFELTMCRFGSVRVCRWVIGTAPKPL